jgi:hypothetical protein
MSKQASANPSEKTPSQTVTPASGGGIRMRIFQSDSEDESVHFPLVEM